MFELFPTVFGNNPLIGLFRAFLTLPSPSSVTKENLKIQFCGFLDPLRLHTEHCDQRKVIHSLCHAKALKNNDK